MNIKSSRRRLEDLLAESGTLGYAGVPRWPRNPQNSVLPVTREDNRDGNPDPAILMPRVPAE